MHSQKHNYALGVKLVHGAYHQHELAVHPHALSFSAHSISISLDPEPPVWLNKCDTDDSYNSSVSILVKAMKQDVDQCAATSGAVLTPCVDPVKNKGWFGVIFSGSFTKRIASEVVGGLSGVPRSTPPLSAPAIGVFFGTHN